MQNLLIFSFKMPLLKKRDDIELQIKHIELLLLMLALHEKARHSYRLCILLASMTFNTIIKFPEDI